MDAAMNTEKAATGQPAYDAQTEALRYGAVWTNGLFGPDDTVREILREGRGRLRADLYSTGVALVRTGYGLSWTGRRLVAVAGDRLRRSERRE